MSNTKREPLLSDDTLYKWSTENILSSVRVRDTYEAARAKDAELIQMAVDAMKIICDYARICDEHPFVDGDKFLAAAEAAGFKPSDR